jgi:hypothetical protein
MDKQLKEKQKNLVNALEALGIDAKSFAAFLETQIEVTDAVKTLVEAYSPQTERAIRQVQVVMYSLR